MALDMTEALGLWHKSEMPNKSERKSLLLLMNTDQGQFCMQCFACKC